MDYENIRIEVSENICIMSICRPKHLNCLNKDTLSEMYEALSCIERDKNIYVLILTGEGKSFVTGADIYEMHNQSPEEARQFAKLGLEVFRKIHLMEKPVIAAVNGFALGGGCELAISCDIIIASESARFGQPEANLGITPGFAGTQRLSRIVGIAKAKELIFTGDMIDASEAERIGLINRVVEHNLLMQEALNMANKIKTKAQLAVRYAKTAINRGVESDIETGMAIEKDLFGLCFATYDQKEGMSAFIEKRKPSFANK